MPWRSSGRNAVGRCLTLAPTTCQADFWRCACVFVGRTTLRFVDHSGVMATFAKPRVPAEDLWYGTHRPTMNTNVLLQHVNPGQVRANINARADLVHSAHMSIWPSCICRLSAPLSSIPQRTKSLVHHARWTLKEPEKVRHDRCWRTSHSPCRTADSILSESMLTSALCLQ